MRGILHTDGACLGNPGPMGLGIVLEIEGQTIKQSIPYGKGTNNIAEYSALIHGLRLAQEHGVTEVEAYLDSKLVVEQVKGNWRVKDATLQQLHQAARREADTFQSFSIEHVPREENHTADGLSKTAAEQV